MIEAIKQRAKIQKERVQKLRDAVKDSKENPRKNRGTPYRPD